MRFSENEIKLFTIRNGNFTELDLKAHVYDVF